MVTAADASRQGAAYTWTKTRFAETVDHRVVYDDHAYRIATAGEHGDATITLGPSNVGGFVRVAPDLGRTPAGPPIAPLAVAGFTLADRELSTGIGPVGPKP